MRDLKRDQQRIWYSLRNITASSDEWGNTTDVKTYGTPLPFQISISGNRGEAARTAFGTELKYDREMSTHDMTCPIDEYSHLWLDGRSTDETHNYIVKTVSRTKNIIRYAVEKVEVS